MKGTSRILSSLLIMFMLIPMLYTSLSADADAVASGQCGENLNWTLSYDGVLTISGTGEMFETTSGWYNYAKQIKSVIIKEGVTTIGRDAFEQVNGTDVFTSLNSITIPTTLLTNNACFRGTPIDRTYISDLSAWMRIDHTTCYSSPLLGIIYVNNEPLRNLIVPDDITEIKPYAFDSCEDELVSVTIHENVTSIGKSAFRSCKSLKSVTFLADVEHIDSSVFDYSDNVTITCYDDCYNVISFAESTSTPYRVIERQAEISFDKNKVTVLYPETLKSISYTKGTYNTVVIYNSKGCKTIQPKDIEAGSKNGVFTFYLPYESGDYTVLLKSRNSEYTYYHTTLPVCDHSFGEYVFNNDATCANNGTESAVCKYCGAYDTVAIEGSVGEHSFGSYTDKDAATCTKNATKYAVCEVCGVTESVEIAGSALGHSFVSYVYNNDATCQKNGTETANCIRCGITDTRILEYNPHSFDAYVYNNDATCQKNGTKTAKCKYCGIEDIIEAANTKLEHDYGEYTYNKDATCITEGTKSAFCQVCGAESRITAEGSVLGHSFGSYISNNDATCLRDGTETAKCVRCEVTDTRIDKGSALGHSFTNYINDGNTDCIHDGTETAICNNGCGASNTRIVEGSAYGHSFTEYVYDNNQTCTEDGTETAICNNGCGASNTRIVEGSAYGHSFTDYVIIFERNCTVNGVKESFCNNGCGEKDVIIDEAKGHVLGDWLVIEEPDYYNEGYKIQNCTVCLELLNSEIIPVLTYKGFPDVWKNSWYAEGIEYCFKHGYILGTNEGIFKPNAELTREQFVVILVRISGAKLSEYTESDFTDVKADSWYGASVIWANSEGLVNGIGNSEFGVGQPMTREQLAVILCRYAEKQGTDTSEKADLYYCDDTFAISDWALDACAWAVKAELLGSTSETANLLSPKMTVTRAQAAKIFMFYDNLE